MKCEKVNKDSEKEFPVFEFGLLQGLETCHYNCTHGELFKISYPHFTFFSSEIKVKFD